MSGDLVRAETVEEASGQAMERLNVPSIELVACTARDGSEEEGAQVERQVIELEGVDEGEECLDVAAPKRLTRDLA